MRNEVIHLDTITFEVSFADIETAKPIAEISLDSTDFLSVLFLPLCTGQNVDNIKYYAIADNHQEYQGNGNWNIPKIFLETKIFTEMINDENENHLDSITLWDNFEKINELVGTEVKAVEGSTIGIVTASYFEDEILDDEHARWVATYFIGEATDSNIYQTITYGADEIADVLLM